MPKGIVGWGATIIVLIFFALILVAFLNGTIDPFKQPGGIDGF